MPTISAGCAGLSDLILPVVLIFSPPMTRLYSRPNSERTLSSAARIARAFSGREKSVNGSLRKGPSGRRRFCLPTRTASSVAAIQVTSTGWDEYLILRQRQTILQGRRKRRRALALGQNYLLMGQTVLTTTTNRHRYESTRSIQIQIRFSSSFQIQDYPTIHIHLLE